MWRCTWHWAACGAVRKRHILGQHADLMTTKVSRVFCVTTSAVLSPFCGHASHALPDVHVGQLQDPETLAAARQAVLGTAALTHGSAGHAGHVGSAARAAHGGPAAGGSGGAGLTGLYDLD